MANTCCNMLYLPIKPVRDEEFNYNILSGIINAAGFGSV